MDSDEELRPPVPVVFKQEVLEEDSTQENRFVYRTWEEGRDAVVESSVSPSLLEPVVTIADGEVPSTSTQLSDVVAQEKEEVAEKIKSGQYILLRKERSRSKVWERFSSVYDATKQRYVGYVQCSNCGCLLSMKLGSGTTHLSRHVCKVINNSQRVFISKEKKNEIINTCVEKCVEMCIKDQLPYTTICGQGFRTLGQELIRIGTVFGNIDIKYVLPPVLTLSQHVSNIADNIRQQTLPEVHKAIQNGNCAMELWTETSNSIHHMAVTSQYITDDWKVQRQLLFASQCLNEKDTNIEVQEEIQTRLAGLGIFSEDIKKLTFVTSQPIHTNHPSVLVNHMQCAAYSLNSVVQCTFDEETFLKISCPSLLKCAQVGKNILKHLKVNGLNKVLEIISKKCALPHWNMIIVVLDMVYHNYDFLVNLLTERNEINFIDGWNNQLVGEILRFLLKFKDVLCELKRNSYPTLHLVLVYFHELYDHCLPCSTDHEETVLVKKRTNFFLKANQFAKKHYIATFLCPNTRLLKRLDPDTRRTVHEEVQNMCSEVNALHVCASQQTPPSKRSRFGAWSQHEEDQGPSFDEIALYLATGRQDSEEPCEFLSWWQGRTNTFPRLSQVARKVLCIPATCSSCEQIIRLSSTESCNLISDQVTDILLAHNQPLAEKVLLESSVSEEIKSQILI